MKIGIFYGGKESGSTARVAGLIAEAFGKKVCGVYNVQSVTKADLESCDLLILGTSAWGIGGMHTDWDDFVDHLPDADISTKKVAFFGLGDQVKYPESFVDGMGTLFCRYPYKENVIGFTSTEGYKYYFSTAEKDNKFVGLAIDDDSQPELTLPRIQNWVSQLRKEAGIGK